MTMLLLLISFFGYVYSDYDCLCNYNVGKGVLSSPNSQAQPIGYLYEFDCKELIGDFSSSPTWAQVAFEHQIGYIEKDAQIASQVCPGDPPLGDKVITTTAATTIVTTKEPVTTTTELKTTITTRQSTTSTTPTTTKPTTTKATTTTNAATSTKTSAATSTTLKTTTTTFSTMPTSTSTTRSTTINTSTSSSSIPKSTLKQTHVTSSTTAKTGHLVCPLKIQQAALSEKSIAFVNDKNGKCYELVIFPRSWRYAEDDCLAKGGHLTSIEDANEENILLGRVQKYGSKVWIGLNDKRIEDQFEWSSGETVSYQKWQAGHRDTAKHSTEDCVTMGTLNGTWDDENCVNYYAYICKFDAVTGLQGSVTNVDGNTQLCSSTVQHLAERDNGILGQFERGCYELIRSADVSWQHGENMCQSRGGHLAHISNQQQQTFIQSFLSWHLPQHAVWIGLHDTRIEGAFEWTAGASVLYTNWIPGHNSNFESFRTEDCVAFIPYKNGKWDDIPCGNNYDLGETHPILCQYKMPLTPGLIG